METFRPKENIPRMFLDEFYGLQYDEDETDDEDVDETKVQRRLGSKELKVSWLGADVSP